MTRFYPQTGTVEEWNTAYYRLEDYLRAQQVTNKVHQSQIILRLLQRAAARHATAQEQTPTQLALEEAYAVIDRWFQHLLPEEPPARATMIGRVSLALIDAPARWPNVFLAEDSEIPPEFRIALRAVLVQSGPELQLSSMVPRPLDAGAVDEPVEEPWEKVGRVSAFVIMGAMLLLLGAALFYLGH